MCAVMRGLTVQVLTGVRINKTVPHGDVLNLKPINNWLHNMSINDSHMTSMEHMKKSVTTGVEKMKKRACE